MRLSISSRLLGLQRYNATLVMMDQFSKLAHMMATTGITTALETKKHFCQCMVGASRIVESDYVKPKSKNHKHVLDVSL